jgi:hypothetical protein
MRNFSSAPQTPWIQVPIASRYNYGPTCQIPANSEASKSIDFKREPSSKCYSSVYNTSTVALQCLLL